MNAVNKKEASWLFLGDLVIFIFSLWLALLLRFGQVPSQAVLIEHLLPFGILFVAWFLVFFIAGLYEKHTTLFKSRLPAHLLNAQLFNSALAVIFFYFIPYFGIKPKTILFIYLIISITLIFVWRTFGQNLFGFKSREQALMLGRGREMDSLLQEVNGNPRYGLVFVSTVDLDKMSSVDVERTIVEKINSTGVSVVVIDLQGENLERSLPRLYSLLFSKVRFIDLNSLYEEIFDRVPLSLLDYNWFLRNISPSLSVSYDFFKRVMDVVISGLLGVLSLILYPFIVLAIKIDDGGPVFIVQERIGRHNLPIRVRKFRTMKFNDNEDAHTSSNNKITRVGKVLRQSRLDELPQLWSVFLGDLSLIGPRPELPALVSIYEREVPYYNIRHLIQPGLSGWAQLYHENHPHQGANTEETKNKLAYDLYYLKNRSLVLDFKIALKTIKALLSRTGR